MIHYTLMQIVVPQGYKSVFLQACNTKLEYFIDARTLLGDGAHSIAEVDAVFDLANSEEFKTIAVKVNPFKRVVLDYLSIRQEIEIGQSYPKLDYYKQFSDLDDFNKFVGYHFSPDNPDETPFLNTCNFYFTDKLSVDYLLEFDTFPEDVKQIPEFSNETDTDYFHDAFRDSFNYRSRFNQASIDLVSEVYAPDLAKYGYTF